MLTEINLPDNIRLIEKEAFHGSGIESIHLPENLKQIGIRAFMSSALKSITVPDKTVHCTVCAFFTHYHFLSFCFIFLSPLDDL